MLATQTEIVALAERIERAYRLRRPHWRHNSASAGVWTTAAALLYRIHQEEPDVPVDPELFVAVQASLPSFDDPWTELTQPAAAQSYRSRVRKIVRGLRAELRTEVSRAEERLRRGEAIDRVLASRTRTLSPLGCFLIARRAGAAGLAERFQAEALEQHRSCPLYRQASRDFLPPEEYLDTVPRATPAITSAERLAHPRSHLN